MEQFPKVVVSEQVPEGDIFLITDDAFDPPPGEDSEKWLANHSAIIKGA